MDKPEPKYCRVDFTPDEYAIIRVAAAHQGISIKAYVHNAAVEQARKQTKTEEKK